jgi:hypothetical protein
MIFSSSLADLNEIEIHRLPPAVLYREGDQPVLRRVKDVVPLGGNP